MNKPQTIIEIDGKPVEIKARIENGWWSVIAHTGFHSIRSNKLAAPAARDSFARAVVHSVVDAEILDDDEQYIIEDGIHEVEKAVLHITNGFTV